MRREAILGSKGISPDRSTVETPLQKSDSIISLPISRRRSINSCKWAFPKSSYSSTVSFATAPEVQLSHDPRDFPSTHAQLGNIGDHTEAQRYQHGGPGTDLAEGLGVSALAACDISRLDQELPESSKEARERLNGEFVPFQILSNQQKTDGLSLRIVMRYMREHNVIERIVAMANELSVDNQIQLDEAARLESEFESSNRARRLALNAKVELLLAQLKYVRTAFHLIVPFMVLDKFCWSRTLFQDEADFNDL